MALLNRRNAYEGPNYRAGSSHRHKSGSVSRWPGRALVPHTDTHSRNSGSRSPSDAEAKAGKSRRNQKHTTRNPNANRRMIIISEYVRSKALSKGWTRVGRVQIH